MLMHLLPDRSNCSCRSAVCVVNMPNCAVKLEAELQKGKMCIYMEKKKKKKKHLSDPIRALATDSLLL